MKTLKILVTVVAFFGLAYSAGAAAYTLQSTQPVDGFGVGSTNVGTALSYAVVSARSGNGGAPGVQYINAGSDTATAVIQFYRCVAETAVTFTNTTTIIPCADNTGFTTNSGVILIRHVYDDTYERRVLNGGSTGTTNLSVTAASLGTCRPGDILYAVTTVHAASIRCGVQTNDWGQGAGFIYVGQAAKPLLVEIASGGTAAAMNAVGGVYLPPTRVPRPGL